MIYIPPPPPAIVYSEEKEQCLDISVATHSDLNKKEYNSVKFDKMYCIKEEDDELEYEEEDARRSESCDGSSVAVPI